MSDTYVERCGEEGRGTFNSQHKTLAIDNKQSGIRIRGEQTNIERAISILNQLGDQADVLNLSREVLGAVSDALVVK